VEERRFSAPRSERNVIWPFRACRAKARLIVNVMLFAAINGRSSTDVHGRQSEVSEYDFTGLQKYLWLVDNL
jgi:hypothetical protein